MVKDFLLPETYNFKLNKRLTGKVTSALREYGRRRMYRWAAIDISSTYPIKSVCSRVNFLVSLSTVMTLILK